MSIHRITLNIVDLLSFPKGNLFALYPEREYRAGLSR
jgi:hypothetical protein